MFLAATKVFPINRPDHFLYQNYYYCVKCFFFFCLYWPKYTFILWSVWTLRSTCNFLIPLHKFKYNILNIFTWNPLQFTNGNCLNNRPLLYMIVLFKKMDLISKKNMHSSQSCHLIQYKLSVTRVQYNQSKGENSSNHFVRST